jgi:hypothetical protein
MLRIEPTLPILHIEAVLPILRILPKLRMLLWLKALRMLCGLLKLNHPKTPERRTAVESLRDRLKREATATNIIMRLIIGATSFTSKVGLVSPA